MGWEKQLICNAANCPAASGNPEFTQEDFLNFYPQFSVVPSAVMDLYIGLANASLPYSRWLDSWQFGMCLFIAHWCTLYLQSMAPENATAQQVIAAAEMRGLKTSKSVGGVSVSVDYSTISTDLDGWAAWKLTAFGTQFSTMARLIGSGGAVLW